MPTKKRSTFTSRLGFVLAAAGSAVGLGNIWRFPYLCAAQGGGIFLLIYLLLVFTLGFVLIITETAIGRKTGLSVIGAFKKLDRKWGFVGVLAALVPCILMPYYCVIGGWVTKYFVDYVIGNGSLAATEGYFAQFSSSTGPPIFWLLVFIGLTTIIIVLGVQKGIETASKILMPALIILTVAVAIYAMTLPGAAPGVSYIFVPDFSDFSVDTVLAAMGQTFYSLSLGAAVMITYGSYMRKDENMEKASYQIIVFDTLVALLASLTIIPAVFAFSGGDEASLLTSGPPLMFITMPMVFDSMGGAGPFFGGLFFLLVFFAALTSSMSMQEAIVSIIRDQWHIKRVPAALMTAVYLAIMALPSTLGFGIWSDVTLNGMNILDIFDFVISSIMMPLVTTLTMILIGWVLTPKVIVDEVSLSGEFRRRRMYRFLVKWIAPPFVGAVLVISVLQGLGIMAGF